MAFHFLPLFLAARKSSIAGDVDPTIPLCFIGVVVAVWIVWRLIATAQENQAKEERKAAIYQKYGRTQIAEAIIARKMWQGQTEDQLRDSLGSPADTDEKVLKTKTKVIWKYAHQGGNRYGLRVTVENGTVVGWDEKL